MKRIKYLYRTLPLLSAALCMAACAWNPNDHDIDKVEEKLELTASADDIVLDEDDLQSDIITFDWTEARQLPDEYVVSYVTKLDVLGNNFGTTTAIYNDEDEGVFSRSFTSEQINNWANEKWKLPVNTPFTLEFRVTVQWTGGPEFQAPEVRTVTVDVEPIHVFTFDADHVYLDGSAIGSRIEIFKTLENENQYAWVGNLVAGELNIPVDFDGATTYICPSDLEGTLQDGVAEGVTMLGSAISWNIATPGQYRVVINMEQTTVTIYSPATDLQPHVVTWPLSGVDQVTTVEKLYLYLPWAWNASLFLSPSLADPQVFVYSGEGKSGQAKFGVATENVAYVYSAGLNAVNVAVTHGTVYTLYEGYGGSGTNNPRNTYFNLPSGTNFIVVDTRNMTMVCNKK